MPGPDLVCTGFQTASRITIGFGISPSLKKRSATACWVSTIPSVTGPIAKDARLAATIWTSSGTPVTAASAAATSARFASAQRAASASPLMTSRVC
jgi:hypothetical protein